MVDQAQEIQLGLQSEKEILSKQRVSRDPQKNAMVRRVGRRIANVTGQKN
jgi:predicted Zn-dependent protease